MEQWEIDGERQAVEECRKRIKGENYWKRLYQQYTGDCDVSDADAGEAKEIRYVD